MYIRKIDIDDFKILKMFHMKHFQSYAISDASFQAYITQSQYQTFGMFHVKHLVGYVIFLSSGEEADIVYIATHPDYRKQGIGTYMIKHYIAISGVSKIFLEVEETNQVALGFYKSLGFEIINCRRNYLHGHPAYMMLLSIR